MEILTPGQVIAEMSRLMGLQGQGIEALFAAENKLAVAESTLDSVEARAFIGAPGTVAERSNLARLAAVESRLARDISKAEMNRIRLKLKSIESSLMAVSVIGRQVELEFRAK